MMKYTTLGGLLAVLAVLVALIAPWTASTLLIWQKLVIDAGALMIAACFAFLAGLW